jgi:hypothetical protein
MTNIEYGKSKVMKPGSYEQLVTEELARLFDEFDQDLVAADGVTAALRREQVMVRYVEASDCLMEFLGGELDDPSAGTCGICQNCTDSGISVELDPALRRSGTEFPRAGPVLLVDDMFDSGWTFTVIGVALRESGSGPVFPFALAAAVSR